MNLLYKSMNIPESCVVGNTLFKKLFYENASMNIKDKELFKDHINKITWEYSFKSDTINILPYKDDEREYDEIALLGVDLEEDSRYKKIAEIIQKTIPYPLILVMKYNGRILINVAHKRLNKVDETKDTIEEFLYTDWIDLENSTERDNHFFESINIRMLSYTNFYKFYSDFVDKVNVFNASQYQESIYDNNLEVSEIKAITDKIENYDKKINEIKNSIKNEKHFNKKMRMNIEIKKNVEKREELITSLSLDGGCYGTDDR